MKDTNDLCPKCEQEMAVHSHGYYCPQCDKPNQDEVKPIRAFAGMINGGINFYNLRPDRKWTTDIEVEIRPIASQGVEEIAKACDDGRDFHENLKLQKELSELRGKLESAREALEDISDKTIDHIDCIACADHALWELSRSQPEQAKPL